MNGKIFVVEVETINSKKIKEATEIYNSGKLKDAIDVVESLLKDNPDDVTIHLGYAEMILNDNSKKSLELVNLGLYIDTNNWVLLKLKADILTNYFPMDTNSQDTLSRLNLALECIQKSIKLFTESYKQTQSDLNSNKIGNEAIVIMNYMQKKFEIENLESTILSLRNSVAVLNRTEKVEQLVVDVENRLYKERTRIIELLGLFVAIFAFIISSIQIANKFDLIDAILIIVALGLILIAFVLALHLTITPKERMGKLFALLGILVFTLFCLPLVPGLIKGIKYYLNL